MSDAEWWEDFFDEDYVETWTAVGSFDDTDQQAADLEVLLDLEPGARILDAACGFGRFAGRLAARGYEVTGIDASATQIRLAEGRHPGPTYEVADLRDPPPGPFDAVVNLFSSFGYFADAEQDRVALAAWRRVLRPGGVLVMETMHRDRFAALHGAPIPAVGGVQETGETDWVTGVRTATVTRDGRARTFVVRVYTVTDLVRLLHEAGFVDVEAFGGLGGGPVSPETRLALRARAPSA